MPQGGGESRLQVIDHRRPPPQATDAEVFTGGNKGRIHCLLVLDITVELKADLACHPLTKCLDGATCNFDLAEVHELYVQKIIVGSRLANRKCSRPRNLQLKGLTLLPSCVIATLG
ncbi:hypothetical protein D3C84_662980 [compost metagenome]